MRTLIQDLRYGFRTTLKTPGTTAVVILSLALGIGANTAIFSLIDALMLKSLPVRNPEQLVLYGDGSNRGFVSGIEGRWNIFSYPLYEYLRDHQKSFQGVCAFRTELDRLSVRPSGTGGNEPAQLAWGRLVSGNYFAVLGVQAVLGRTLTARDDRPEARPVAVMSYEYWSRRFGRSPAVAGQVLNINGTLFTVAGVTPPEFFGESVESGLADFWLPVSLQPQVMYFESALKTTEVNWINLIGRLKPGVGMEQAQADAGVAFHQFLTREAAAAKLSEEEQTRLRKSYITLTPGSAGISNLRFHYSRPLQVLLAVVALVLVIACANVANVLLSRSAAREKEISMRLALGAGRARLVRQLLTESTLLACLGGLLGVLFAAWGVSALVAAVSEGSAPLNVTPDARMLGFTLGISLLTGILFGLAPALRASRLELAAALKGSTAGATRGMRWGMAKTLVIAQGALSLPLLVGAGLFLATLDQLQTQDLGFKQDHVLEVGIDAKIAGYLPGQLESLYRSLLDRVNGLPGVRVASLSLYSPMSNDNWSGQVSVEGYTPPPHQAADTQWVWVGPRYAETAGMKLLLGRDLQARDTAAAPKVAVVNESFVHRYLANQYPVGRRFSMNVPANEYEVEIVGVVKDFKFNDPRQEFWPVVFMPLVQASMVPASYAAYLEVRTAAEPAAMASAIRQAIQAVDKNLPVTGVRTLAEQIGQSLNRERLIARLSTFFGLLALLLACVGLYGVVAHAVARRTSEIGIRMALGARRGDILRMVLREAMLLVLLGAAAGLLAALGLARFIASQLYGIHASDPRTLAAAAALLLAVAAVAGYLPARRASRVQPMTALRME
jgi:macrolide transport system ATP-binding/permease protein